MKVTIDKEMYYKINKIVQEAVISAQECKSDVPILVSDLHEGDGQITAFTDEIVWLLEGLTEKEKCQRIRDSLKEMVESENKLTVGD